MAKISRPIIYTLVAGAALYAAVVFTEPKPTPRKPAATTRTAPTSAASRTKAGADSNITPEDLTAEFPRYVAAPASRRDPFHPGVAPKNSGSAGGSNGVGLAPVMVDPSSLVSADGARQKWTLTGISSINGVRSALVENGRPEDSVFLKTGDNWNGLHVAQIEPDAVIFANGLGQRTRLTFIVTVPETAGTRSANTPNSGTTTNTGGGPQTATNGTRAAAAANNPAAATR